MTALDPSRRHRAPLRGAAGSAARLVDDRQRHHVGASSSATNAVKENRPKSSSVVAFLSGYRTA
ncbi:MAG: hypothetical protein H6708_29960 [Kofleriaceae bacterium]|nr:hypothetical protein [Myxococcales bacterium]MCB9564631.1 hypothetical protein [Kofleriaceae bacterium]